MKSYGYRIIVLPIFGLVLVLALAACGPDESSSRPKQSPTNTPISASVPKADTPLPSPAPAYPTATGEDLQLISQAVTNTSAANLKSYHYVMTSAMPSFPNTVTEGDYVQGQGNYMKVTQKDSVEETLILSNTSYCRDSSGKWIVQVADLRAKFAQADATMQAQMDEEMKKEGINGTPQPIPTHTYGEVSPNQLATYGGVDPGMYAFSYAGEESVEGVTTRHYIGTFSWGKGLSSLLGSDTNGTPIAPVEATAIAKQEATAVASAGPQPLETLSLWIDPSSVYVRKLENVFEMSSRNTVAMGYMYSYGCGVDPHSQPTPTAWPTPPPQSGERGTILIITRQNDPTITLPQP